MKRPANMRGTVRARGYAPAVAREPAVCDVPLMRFLHRAVEAGYHLKVRVLWVPEQLDEDGVVAAEGVVPLSQSGLAGYRDQVFGFGNFKAALSTQEKPLELGILAGNYAEKKLYQTAGKKDLQHVGDNRGPGRRHLVHVTLSQAVHVTLVRVICFTISNYSAGYFS